MAQANTALTDGWKSGSIPFKSVRFAFTLDLLGEAIISDVEADRYQQSYIDLIEGMSEKVDKWSEIPTLDYDHNGAIPRLNVSVKLSALDSQFSSIDPVGTRTRVLERLRPILRSAQEHNAYIHVDMEQYDYKNLTLDIFKHVLMEDEFRTSVSCRVPCYCKMMHYVTKQVV